MEQGASSLTRMRSNTLSVPGSPVPGSPRLGSPRPGRPQLSRSLSPLASRSVSFREVSESGAAPEVEEKLGELASLLTNDVCEASPKVLLGIFAVLIVMVGIVFHHRLLHFYVDQDLSGVGLRLSPLVEFHVEGSPRAWVRFNVTELCITFIFLRLMWVAIGTATRAFEVPRLIQRADEAVKNVDEDALSSVFRAAEALDAKLPKTFSEYQKELHEKQAKADFEEQVIERTRINISLNVWEFPNPDTDGQLGLRTLVECPLAEMFPGLHAQMMFEEAANKVDDNPNASAPSQTDSAQVLSRTQFGQGPFASFHPFIGVEPVERQRFCDQIMNRCSALAPQGSLLFDMGVDTVSEKYVFGITFEKLDTGQQNRKFRLLLVRESFLRHVRSRKPGDVHKHPYFQYRWRTLQQLHDLYFEDVAVGGKLQRIEQGLLISSPDRPLILTLPGVTRRSQIGKAPWEQRTHMQ